MRFPGFEGEWESKKFEDVCRIGTGNKNTQDKIDDGKYPFYVRSSTIEKINDYTFDGEAILTAGDGVGVGKVFHYTHGKIGIHQRVYILRDFKNINGKFLFYYFSTRFYDRVNRLSAKNSVDSVRYDMIAKMALAAPSDEEQSKIANLLSLIDERIQTQSKIIKDSITLLKNISKGLLSGSIKFDDTSNSKLEDWRKVQIGNILKIGSGRDYKHLQSGEIPVFGTGGLMTYVNDYLYEGETVCIGRKGTIDKPFFFKGKVWTVDTLFYTHSFKGVYPKYIYYVFQAISWKQYNEASGVPSLSKSTIEKIEINIPSISEQHKIAQVLSSIDKKINLEKIILDKLQDQKKYFLKSLFI